MRSTLIVPKPRGVRWPAHRMLHCFICRFKKFFLHHFCELRACRIDGLFASLRAKCQPLRPGKHDICDAHEAQ
jgi:hypothetical protein